MVFVLYLCYMKNKDVPGLSGKTFKLMLDKSFLYDDAVLRINNTEFRHNPNELKYNKIGIDMYVRGIELNVDTRTYTYLLEPKTAGWSDYK